MVIAKWLATKPRVLILDEPTRGVDIGAKVEVHRIMSDLAASGLGIILISSELPEILAMSDRTLVLHEGRVTAEIARADATEERVMFAATGQMASPDALSATAPAFAALDTRIRLGRGDGCPLRGSPAPSGPSVWGRRSERSGRSTN